MNYNDVLRQKRRLTSIYAGLAILALLLIMRLVDLQLVSHQHYLVLAAKEHSRQYQVPAHRGQLYLLDGDQKSPLALNQSLKVLYADPTQVTDKTAAAEALSRVTGDSAASYSKLLHQPGEYVVLKTRVDGDLADRVSRLKLAGIALAPAQYRSYPEGSLAAQVVGFVNASGDGQYGVEGFLNNDLAGTPGLTSAKTDTRGNPIATANNIINPPTDGKSFVLTIDRNIQAEAEKVLAAGVDNVHAVSGSVIIMDPSTGAVRAMANYPTFDPNGYDKQRNYQVFTNNVVSNQFEPGSGFKIFTMAAGLDTGHVKPDTKYTDTGVVKIDDREVHNAEDHKFGVQTMVDVIQKSLNTGVVFVLKSLGGDPDKINTAGKTLFYDYITKHFGFGVATGIEQTGEATGAVNPPSAPNVNYANMTFGQGISVTMLQMVTAATAIANGGKLYQPYLIDQTILPDATVQKRQPRVVNDHVISPQTVGDLTNMMVQVVQHGSGYAAKMPGYQVAGKTGTAQIPDPNHPGYLTDKNSGSFVGFAPVGNPKFVMMVRINEPKIAGNQFAESTTVPVFAQIATWLLQYYQVPPS
jgi:cell division protein FtsI/penicillin-binding protein 2